MNRDEWAKRFVNGPAQRLKRDSELVIARLLGGETCLSVARSYGCSRRAVTEVYSAVPQRLRDRARREKINASGAVSTRFKPGQRRSKETEFKPGCLRGYAAR